jgi:DNA replication protein DnaC
MRPARVKRPTIAADGTVLSGTPPHKRQKLASPEIETPPKQTLSKKKVVAEVSSDEDSSESEDVESAKSPLEALQESVRENHLHGAQKRVLSIMTGRLPPPGLDKEKRFNGSECIGLQDQWMNLRATVKGTIQGEGNSALLVGVPGCGKTLVSISLNYSLSLADNYKAA